MYKLLVKAKVNIRQEVLMYWLDVWFGTGSTVLGTTKLERKVKYQGYLFFYFVRLSLWQRTRMMYCLCQTVVHLHAWHAKRARKVTVTLTYRNLSLQLSRCNATYVETRNAPTQPSSHALSWAPSASPSPQVGVSTATLAHATRTEGQLCSAAAFFDFPDPCHSGGEWFAVHDEGKQKLFVAADLLHPSQHPDGMVGESGLRKNRRQPDVLHVRFLQLPNTSR